MKSTSILILGTITILLLSACSTSNNVVSNRLLSKRKYTKGFHIRSNGMTREEKKVVSDESRYNITLKDQFEKKSRNGSSIAIVQKGEEIDHYKNEALEDFSHETGDELLDLRFLSDQNVLNDKPNIERTERTLKTENSSQFNERSGRSSDDWIYISDLVIVLVLVVLLVLVLTLLNTLLGGLLSWLLGVIVLVLIVYFLLRLLGLV